jgi:mRNA interferase RelE/StbE
MAAALRLLADDPVSEGAKPLKGPLRGLFRIRVGEWRVAYRVDTREQVVLVVEIGHRAHVYERARRRRQ